MNSPSPGTKLLLLALDGLSFPLVKRLIDAGDLPVCKALMDRGATGLFEPFSPSNSAVIWTSVMTGMHPRKHGIDSFIYYTAGGRVFRKSSVKKLLKLGFRPVFNRLKGRGYIRDHPFTLSMVRQKMIWELFAECGREVGIVNWWHSWPVPELPGFIVSDRVHYWRSEERHRADDAQAGTGLVHPPQLTDDIMRRVVNPFDIRSATYQQFMTVDEATIGSMKHAHYERHQLMSEFKYLYAMDESVKDIALYCLEQVPQPDLLALYFRGIDIMSHCALKYAPHNRDASISDEEVHQFGDAVAAYYRYSDALLGDIIGAVSRDTAVLVVSDHGFEREPDGRFGHRKTRPPGMFLAAGGPFTHGGSHPQRATLYDLAPTILYLSGLPCSRQMDGRVLAEWIDATFVREHPVNSVASYGPPVRRPAPLVPESEELIKERLRALGYID
jgi:predicted AlkP superfamily phosphohydrolase/phosphomutase